MRIIAILAVLVLTACTATHERPMRASEKTLLSEDVSQRLAENDGMLDTRKEKDIRCDRIKITGSHLVTRVCYTLGEDEDSSQMSQDRLERVLNDTPRPRGEGRGPG
ncbi:MAG: hypothetical protein AAGE01_10430 [Pseudomonadota bacterium]